MPSSASACAVVSIDDALIAKTDTNLRLAEECDGEIYCAA